MKNVKIIKGYYGAKIGVKGANDAPFSLDDAEAARIVALGVAVYACSEEIEAEKTRTETEAKKSAPKKRAGTRGGKSE